MLTNDNHHLSEIKLLRIKEVLKIIPVGKSTWWDGVKKGRFPKPIKLGARTTAWKYNDIRSLIKEFEEKFISVRNEGN